MSEVTEEGLAREAEVSVAGALKAAREGMNLSIDDIGQKTRIPLRFLNAIEAGDHSDLPSAMYAVGFVRTYAKAVGLDGQALGERFRQEIGYDRARTAMPEFMEEADPARVPPRWLVLGGVLAALLVALAYWVIRAQSVPSNEEIAQAVAGTDVPVAQPGPVAKTPAAIAPATTSGNVQVVLTAVENVWLRVYERNGATLFERELAKGESWQVPTNAVDPLILTGRPQSLIVRVGADVMPPLGKGDKSINDVSLKPEALRALAQSGVAAATMPATATSNGQVNSDAKAVAPVRAKPLRRRTQGNDAAGLQSASQDAAASATSGAAPSSPTGPSPVAAVAPEGQ
ncbi:helix-turn-helix domain-containing protein [Aquisediminimonas sediminicola]|uniref:helix-turn-helix domain-containing protein n=1 Tax=Alteraquisediminimonas sediminicola TaxID=2676787 RepID=UPI001C8F0C6D|nr:helix-turn-helix domain-containing protein [Aquisediminimonas sediminicola]